MPYEIKGDCPPFELWREEYFLGYLRTEDEALNVIENLTQKRIKFCNPTDSGKYFIQKSVNGKTVRFGTYDTLEEAVEIVGELEKVGWDKSRLDEIKSKVLKC